MKEKRNMKRKFQAIEDKFYRTVRPKGKAESPWFPENLADWKPTARKRKDKNPFWPEERRACELTPEEKRKFFEEPKDEEKA